MYKEIYKNILERAKTRSLKNCYFEKHHIIPRSLGGSRIKNNIYKKFNSN